MGVEWVCGCVKRTYGCGVGVWVCKEDLQVWSGCVGV